MVRAEPGAREGLRAIGPLKQRAESEVCCDRGRNGGMRQLARPMISRCRVHKALHVSLERKGTVGVFERRGVQARDGLVKGHVGIHPGCARECKGPQLTVKSSSDALCSGIALQDISQDPLVWPQAVPAPMTRPADLDAAALALRLDTTTLLPMCLI